MSNTTLTYRSFSMLLFVFAMLFARQGQAQNSPACDSVSITNFRFDTMPGQLALEAANISSNGFGYPGFIFFDSNMDTLAKETVDYFGIWNSPQTHKLVIKNQINSPQTGFLSLYGGFYDTLYCTWPVTLQDTPLAATESLYGEIEMSPNPSSGQVKLRWTQQGINTPASATVFNLRGQIVAELPRIGLNPVFSVEDWTPGLYLVQIRTAGQQQICLKKLLVR